MLKYKIGDSLEKNVGGKVFEVAALTKKTATRTAGWPLTKDDRAINPRFCSLPGESVQKQKKAVVQQSDEYDAVVF